MIFVTVQLGSTRRRLLHSTKVLNSPLDSAKLISYGLLQGKCVLCIALPLQANINIHRLNVYLESNPLAPINYFKGRGGVQA